MFLTEDMKSLCTHGEKDDNVSGRRWPSGQRAGVVTPETRAGVPQMHDDSLKQSPSGGRLPSAASTFSLPPATLSWSTAGQREP